MNINIVTADGEGLLHIETDGYGLAPAKGDVILAPNGIPYVILQRSYIMQEKKQELGTVVELGAPKSIEIDIQCIATPAQTVGGDNAILQ